MKLIISDGVIITPEIREKLNFLRDKGPVFTLRAPRITRPGWKVVVTEIRVKSANEIRLFGFERSMASGSAWYELNGTKMNNYILEEATL